MKEAIEYTKIMISWAYGNYSYNNNSLDYSYYNNIYLFTNEHIDSYFSVNKFRKNQKALTVLASGDQAFNLIAKGIKKIDTFDINKLTEYYVFGFKCALINKCSYSEFLETYSKILNFKTPPEEINSIISDVITHMDEKYRKYWQEIQNFYLKMEKESERTHNLFEILLTGRSHITELKSINTYLSSKKAYDLFKTKLMQANITFKHADAIRLTEQFDDKYDYLLLSNILDYVKKPNTGEWGIIHLNQYIDSIKPLMNDNGLIYLHYSFKPYAMLIAGSSVSRNDFKKNELLEIKREDGKANLMILKRVNPKKRILFGTSKNN